MRRRMIHQLLAGMILGMTMGSALAQTVLREPYLTQSFRTGENQDAARLKQDQTQQECSKYRNQPPPAVAAAIVERERKNIVYPADGKLMGDWKTGEKYARMGFAARIGVLEPDKPDADRGGNCYACHAIDAKEIAAGNLGVTLRDYGRRRGMQPEAVRYTYEKIYNAQAFNPCSNMPRLGYHGILSPEKVAHITAYLLDPESPVNK